jgi:hypothetical protein
MLLGVAQGAVSLDAARIGAQDVPALTKFYESAFGLKEVNRLQFPGMLEILTVTDMAATTAAIQAAGARTITNPMGWA